MKTIFPKHNIDPRKKGREWHLQFAKAIWDDQEHYNSNMFYKGKDQYDLIDKYVLGEQPTDEYKNHLLGADRMNDERSLMAIDWERRRHIAAKLREIAISKVLERGYNYRCTPIDSLAKNAVEDYYAKTKIKIMQRDMALAANPELVQNPAFIREHGEPEDLEELEMEMDYGPARKMATDSEIAIQLIMYKNQWEEIRKKIAEDLVDKGVAGVVEDIDDAGENVIIEAADISSVVMSFCQEEDFSDMTYWGVVREYRLSQLASKFKDDELEIIRERAAENRQYTYTTSEFNDDYDPFKVKVLHFRFYSWDSQIYQQRVDKRGNLIVRKEEYSESLRRNTNTVEYNGEKIRQFQTKTKEVIYEGKWIIGTDFIFDWGRVKHEKRSKPNRALTQMGCHFRAYTFRKMRASSLMKRLIPIIDEYQETVYQIQNFKNKWIPYVMNINMDSLENVALGGKKLTPKQLLNMVYRNFTLVSRRNAQLALNPNYKGIEIEPTGMASEYQVLVNDLVRLYNEMREIVGLNEVTDSSSPNPNLLNGVASLGVQGTNNALRQVINAHKKIGESVARGIIQRAVHLVKNGKKIEGLLPAMGAESMRFFQVSPDIALHDWGIMVEDIPTQEERDQLMHELAIKDANGMVDPEASLIIRETNNLKQARARLAYHLKKKKREAEQYEMQKMQLNWQGQAEAGERVEKAKQATIMLEQKLITERELELKRMDIKMLEMKLGSAERVKDADVAGKVATQVVANEGKVQAAAAKPDRSNSEK